MSVATNIGDDFATMLRNGKFFQIESYNPNFDEAVEALKIGGDENYDKFEMFCRPLQFVKPTLEKVAAGIEGAKFIGADMYINGRVVEHPVAEKILEIRQNGKLSEYKDEVQRLTNFLILLLKNPSKTCVEVAFDFSVKHGIFIDQEGYMIGLKAVNPDYTDRHTGKISNKVGEKPEMPRNQVDDSRVACSLGFHIGSMTYSGPDGWFYKQRTDGHIMICKFSPEDIVSIPEDITQDKIRVCKYEVIDEYTEEYESMYEAQQEDCCEDSYECCENSGESYTTFDPFANDNCDDCDCDEDDDFVDECLDCGEYLDNCCCEEDYDDDYEDENVVDDMNFENCEPLDKMSFFYDKYDGNGPQQRFVRVVGKLEDGIYADNIEPDVKKGETGKHFLRSRMTQIRFI